MFTLYCKQESIANGDANLPTPYIPISKDRGFTAFLGKEDGEWLNYCLDCAAEVGLTPPLRGNRISPTTRTDSSVIRNASAPHIADSSVLRGAHTGTQVHKAGETRATDRVQSREVPTVSMTGQERDEDDSFEAALARIQAAEQEFLRSQNGAR